MVWRGVDGMEGRLLRQLVLPWWGSAIGVQGGDSLLCMQGASCGTCRP